MSIIEQARNLRKLIKEYAVKSEDKTLVIAASEYFKPWTPDSYSVGDIRLNQNGVPKECITAHDSVTNPNWTIDVATFWKPYHSRKADYALPYEAPTGAHDMYKAGEYMIYTDGNIYHCLQDTNFNPSEYSQAWKMV